MVKKEIEENTFVLDLSYIKTGELRFAKDGNVYLTSYREKDGEKLNESLEAKYSEVNGKWIWVWKYNYD